jgi:hypothetical protein
MNLEIDKDATMEVIEKPGFILTYNSLARNGHRSACSLGAREED